jgi:hypothetical protein
MANATVTRSWLLAAAAIAAILGCGVKKYPDELPASGSGGEEASGGSGGEMAPPSHNGGRETPASGGSSAGGKSGLGGSPRVDRDAAPGSDAPGRSEPDAPMASGGATGAGGQPDAGSGITVSINGMTVPKEKAIVFIHIGHSDMAGRALEPASLKPFFYDTDPHLWMYAKGGKWKQAMEPTAGDGGSGQGAGPGMAILRTALGYAPDAYMISIGRGQSGAASGFCPNFRKGQVLYPLFMDAAKELKGKVTFGGIFTMLGITEYHLGAPGLNSFADCLVGIANDIRADLGEPDLPLMVGGWNMGGTGIYDPDGMYGKIIRPQMEMVPGKTMNAAVIHTDGFPMHDDRHLSMAGHKMWAELAFKILNEKMWLPWATTMP